MLGVRCLLLGVCCYRYNTQPTTLNQQPTTLNQQPTTINHKYSVFPQGEHDYRPQALKGFKLYQSAIRSKQFDIP
ncbi:MAG: hypothetical protein DSM106950_31795 [Stigonema ocellatum SAG 48.90 = DSM 106950]|nr:hypothetical protein [Stigonema ocellatum SAG 48.90 = DSM 106950]